MAKTETDKAEEQALAKALMTLGCVKSRDGGAAEAGWCGVSGCQLHPASVEGLSAKFRLGQILETISNSPATAVTKQAADIKPADTASAASSLPKRPSKRHVVHEGMALEVQDSTRPWLWRIASVSALPSGELAVTLCGLPRAVVLPSALSIPEDGGAMRVQGAREEEERNADGSARAAGGARSEEALTVRCCALPRAAAGRLCAPPLRASICGCNAGVCG
eukprot:258489-Rhodomonas_salina.1